MKLTGEQKFIFAEIIEKRIGIHSSFIFTRNKNNEINWQNKKNLDIIEKEMKFIEEDCKYFKKIITDGKKIIKKLRNKK